MVLSLAAAATPGRARAVLYAAAGLACFKVSGWHFVGFQTFRSLSFFCPAYVWRCPVAVCMFVLDEEAGTVKQWLVVRVS